jgi:WD repeat-containing protein 48
MVVSSTTEFQGNHAHLWTASRDSTIKRWSLGDSSPRLEAEYLGHVDWVNSIVLTGNGTILASCSSDGTLRLWPAYGGTCTDSSLSGLDSSVSSVSSSCLVGHRDYVMSLAASGQPSLLASGGLQGELFLWDIAAQTSTSSPLLKAQGIHASIYSVSMDVSGNVVSAGTSDGSIWLVDARSGRTEAQLRGHTDNVRAMWMKPDYSSLYSGSADHTVRAWDVRQRRTLSTFAVHTDSVWTLHPAGPSAIITGGRDGCVYRTELGSRLSELLVKEEDRPITAVAVETVVEPINVATPSNGMSMWVGTRSSTLRNYIIPLGPTRHPGAFVAGSLPKLRARTAFCPERGTEPVSELSHPPPLAGVRPGPSIQGAPSIVKVAVLTNRRHVLTQDDVGVVQLWDLCQGIPLQGVNPAAPLEVAERQFFDPSHNVASWFSPDTRLGCLAGVVTPSTCFSAEAYRRELGEEDASPDAKINIGEQVLKALFKNVAPKDVVQSVFTMQGHLPPVIMVSGDATNGNGATPDANVMVKDVPWRCALDVLDSKHLENGSIPEWVSNCVLHGKYPVSKDAKIGFTLIPAPASGLPALLQPKLSAPRVLGIDKVADYVLRKMADQGIDLAEEPLFWSEDKLTAWESEHADSAGDAGMNQEKKERSTRGASLLITCDGVAVPWDFSLAAVRRWMWKRSEDLRLEFGVRSATTELKLPTIRPPDRTIPTS